MDRTSRCMTWVTIGKSTIDNPFLGPSSLQGSPLSDDISLHEEKSLLDDKTLHEDISLLDESPSVANNSHHDTPFLDEIPLSDGIPLHDKDSLLDKTLHDDTPFSDVSPFVDDSSLRDSPLLDISTLSGGISLYDRDSLLDDRILHEDIPLPDDFPFVDDSSPHDCLLSDGSPLHDEDSPLKDRIVCEDNPLTDASPFVDYSSLCDCLPLDDTTFHDSGLLLLPADIIINILSRLTVECVLQGRRVCKPLREMMSTPHFVAMHLNRATPVLVVQYGSSYPKSYAKEADLYPYDIYLHFIDGGNKIMAASIRVNLSSLPGIGNKPILMGSYNGLLLFKNMKESILYIWNPITQEQVTLIAPSSSSVECGLFFHTPTGEYRVLYMNRRLLGSSKFLILSMGTKSLREISNCTNTTPCTCKPPIILNGALHWISSRHPWCLCVPFICSKSILLFNINSEDFVTMPHPGGEFYSKKQHGLMQLLEKEGHLCLCDISLYTEVHLWVLEDYKERVWVKRHIINIESITSICDCTPALFCPIQPVQIHNEELLLQWVQGHLYYCHLKLNTLREVDQQHKRYDSFRSAVTHTNSFASLNSTDILISLRDPGINE